MSIEPSNLAARTNFQRGPGNRHMSNKRLLRLGIVGTIVAALCCFTPVLALLLGAVGLAALIGWLDPLLLPALALFLVITGYALWKREKAKSS